MNNREQLIEILRSASEFYLKDDSVGITVLFEKQADAILEQFRSPDMAEALTSEELGELIDKHIGGMFGGLEMASIDHFKQTGKINGSFRLRLISLMKFYEFKLKDKALSSSGSGWVSVEDAKPNGRLCAVLVCNNWAPEHKRCTRTALWFGQTNKFFMDCDNAFTAHEISHWQPLPAPPGE